MSDLAFVDTETTGLDPDRHEIWEVALIVDGDEYEWWLPVDLGRADAVALRIGHFHDRYPDKELTARVVFAEEFAALTRGRHLCGAVVSFDEERLRRLLRAYGACPEWHYHLIDVEALAVGFLAAQDVTGLTLPWNSDDLSRSVGVEPPSGSDRHTALGDARWAKAIAEKIL